MITLLTIVHVLVCLFLIGIVLLQHGKGADVGATFGGSSQSLFGTEGPLPLLNKITTASAIIFMLTSVTLAYYSADKSTSSVMQEVEKQQQQQMNTEEPVQKKEIIVPLPTEEPVETKGSVAPLPTKEPKMSTIQETAVPQQPVKDENK